MSDIVERLLDPQSAHPQRLSWPGPEAADEIKRLRGALEWIAANHFAHPTNMVAVAKEALERTKAPPRP